MLTKIGDVLLAVLIVVSIVASFGLAINDLLTGQLSGNAFSIEVFWRALALFWLFSLATGVALDQHLLTGIGLSFVGNACLLRQGVGALWSNQIHSDEATLVTGIYLTVGLLGLLCLVVGWRQGERWLKPPKSSSAVPGWLKPAGPLFEHPGVGSKSLSAIPDWLKPMPKDKPIPVIGLLVALLALASNVVNVFTLGRLVWPDSRVLPILVLCLIGILGIAGVVSIVNRYLQTTRQGEFHVS